MFLTAPQLVELTDCQRAHEQRAWLDERGWAYEVSRLGRVKVLHRYAEMRLGLPHDAPESIDLSEFDGEAPIDWLFKRWDKFRFDLPEIIVKSFPYSPADARIPQVGIYFLIASGKIMYVGQSVQVPHRLVAHAKAFRFTHVFAFVAPSLLLDPIEAEYIHRFLPEWNAKIPPRTQELPWCS